MEPCTIDTLGTVARCGVYEVWENRSAKSGRRIPIRVVVIPATDSNPAPDPIIPFLGGPGDGAASQASDFVQRGGGRRDVVLVDMRGTGASNLLACPFTPPPASGAVLDSLFPGWLIAPCRDTLSTRADLRQYTTTNKIADLAEILDWLGYGAVNVSGGSYGTRTAAEFMRRHPERTRTAFLAGLMASDVRTLPLEMARSAQTAIEEVFSMCEKAPDCQKAFPRVRSEFAALVDRISKGPVPVTVAIDGKPAKALFGRIGFGYAVRGALYGELAQWLPLLIHRAYTSNDFSWFASYWLVRGTWAWTEYPVGLYLSVVCTEDMGPASEDSVRRATANTFLGDGLYRQYERACADWPRGELPASLHEPLHSNIPALVISGTRDPVTPAAYGDRVAAGLSGGARIIFKNAGHGGGPRCERMLRLELLERGSADGMASGECAKTPGPFAFALSGDPPARLIQ